jgi:hypothetical protein
LYNYSTFNLTKVGYHHDGKWIPCDGSANIISDRDPVGQDDDLTYNNFYKYFTKSNAAFFIANW